MSDKKRKKVRETTYTTMDWNLDGKSIPEAIEVLTNLGAKFGPGAKLVYQSKEYEDGYELRLVIERDETDAEMEVRLADEKMKAQQRLEWDRAQYEKLKKRFEKEGDTR